MREVLIDVTRLVDRRMRGRLPTGVDRVSLEYLKHFGSNARALVRYSGCWIELSRKDSERVFDGLLSQISDFNLLIRWMVAKAFPRSVGQRFATRRFLFNTGHSGLERPEYSRRLQRSGLRPVFVIYDLIPVSHPEYCRVGESLKHRSRLNAMLRTGHGVIAISAATLTEIEAFARANALPIPRHTVALLAPARLPSPSVSVPSRKPYFVTVGTIEPRKNHWLVLQLWRKLVERFGDKAPSLVVIGQRGWECENVVDLLERCEALRGHVLEVPRCSDAELSSWLSGAQALLFPSFVEGYGMPLVEALALGVPVIASDLPVFREIAGGIPEYIDPLDGNLWWDKIVEYTSPLSGLRREQLSRISGFRVPTWETHFERVETLMEQLSIEDR